ncbi:hypothetical protein AHF37_07298 [Paragonimus kellicotti]|nr:hypothetical protein AHF37_07298 [Paragonimus kellicotti]
MSSYDQLFAINPAFNDSTFIGCFKDSYTKQSTEPFIKNGCCLLKLPFSCASFENFFQPDLSFVSQPFKSAEELVDKIESEARLLPFEPRCNDMFTFKQSVDIVNLLKDEQHVEYKSSILVKLR